MKRRIGILCFLFCMILVSCQKKNTEFRMTEELEGQEREEVNAMIGTFASDGEDIFMSWGDVVYQVDLEAREIKVNCDDLLCDHESMQCSAKLPDKLGNNFKPYRKGEHVYAIDDEIYEIGKNAKKKIGSGGYGQNGVKIFFGDYIAYFEKEDVIVVKEIESDREVQRFEDIRGFQQGNFYYKGCLYYVTDELQLMRLDLITGEKEILEKKGATRASVYEGFIYYIKVSEETETNCLIKMNPDTLEKQELVEGVFYYNMLGDTLYYTAWPEEHLYYSDLNGSNRKEIFLEKDFDLGFIWAFPQAEILILQGDNTGKVFYLLDAASGEIDYEKPLVRPGKDEEEEMPDWLIGIEDTKVNNVLYKFIGQSETFRFS